MSTSDDLRARIGQAYDEGCRSFLASQGPVAIVPNSPARPHIVNAILAALPEADRDEVAGFIYTEECPGGGSQYDWNEAARQADYLLSRYHMIPKGTA